MNTKSARRAAEFVRGVDYDIQGRLESAVVPGHEARLYCVSFRRGMDVMNCQCRRDTGDICKGNKHSICFHVLAALVFTARRHKMRLTFCKTQERAQLISRTGGTIVELISDQSQKRGWIVYRSLKEQAKENT